MITYVVISCGDLYVCIPDRVEGLLAIVVTDRDGIPLIKGTVAACTTNGHKCDRRVNPLC